MSNTAKVCWCFSCMDENQLVADVEFFHCLRPVFRLIVVLIFSRSCLLIRPISLLASLTPNNFDSLEWACSCCLAYDCSSQGVECGLSSS